MLEHFLIPVSFVLSSWIKVPLLTMEAELLPSNNVSMDETVVQVSTISGEFTNWDDLPPEKSPWPWILIGAAGGLGVGLGVYGLNRANSHQVHYFSQDKQGRSSYDTQSTPSSRVASRSPSSTRKGQRRISPKTTPNNSGNAKQNSAASRTATTQTTAMAQRHSGRSITHSAKAYHSQDGSLTKISRTEVLLSDLHSPNAQTQRHAIWELGQQGSSDAIQPLMNVMLDADSQQRSLILGAIAEISTRTLTSLNRSLIISLQDQDAEVRKNAIRDLTRVYALMTQISQILAHAVADEDQEVKATALWALEQFEQMSSTVNHLVTDLPKLP